MTILRVLVAAVLISATFCFTEIGAFFNSARKDEQSLTDRTKDSLTKIATAAQHVDLTQREQSLYLQAEQNHLRKITLPMADKALLQSAQTFYQLGTLISNTDASLNRRPDGVLPTLQGTAVSVDQGIQMFTTSTQPVIDETAQAAHKFEQAMTAASELSQDESWQHIPENLDAITTSLVEASGNVNATTRVINENVQRCARKHGVRRLFCVVF